MISPDARVAGDAEIGCNVVIHGLVELQAGAVVQDGAVLGKVPRLAAHSTAPRDLPDMLVVERDATVCTGAVIFAGAHIGPGAIVGDQAFVRERAVLGERTVVGRGSAVDNDVTIGERVRIQTNCYLTAFSVVEDDVFVAPGVTTTNDHAMTRHGPDHRLRGALLRRACRIGGAAVLVPGVEIGEEAFVAAGAVVVRDVPARAVMMGVPARQVREVPDSDLLERWR